MTKSRRALAWATLALLAALTCACGKETAPTPKTKNVSFSTIGMALVFFDHDTGNLWVYADPAKPAELIGHLDSFDQPLVTAAIQAKLEKTAHAPAPLPPASPPPAALPRDDRPLVEKLNALPPNLWPANDENQVKRQTRDAWLKDNVKLGLNSFTGKIESVSAYGGSVTARLETEKVSIWGKEMPLHINVTFADLKPADVIDWKDGQTLTVQGSVESSTPESGMFGGGYVWVNVTLTHAHVKP